MSVSPKIYLLHGDDPVAIQRRVDTFFASLGDPGMADLNTARLDGKMASEEDLRNALLAIPFLAERRMVVLSNPLARLSSDTTRNRFINLLNGLPETTLLVMVIEDVMDRREWKTLPVKASGGKKHWLRDWMEKSGERVLYEVLQLPDASKMPDWIMKAAREMGGKFNASAAATLAQYIGNDTRAARLEIDKLLTYVNFQREVEGEDVEMLTAPGSQADVFKMVDALAEGNARAALAQLERLLEDQEPLNLFGMIVRQFRLLLQGREVLDEGGNAGEIASALHQHPFVADKIARQARRFSMKQLLAIYRRLAEMDEAMKSGQVSPVLALETLVVELGRA